MEMRKCENGHYYDASVNSTCPYCNNQGSYGQFGSDTGKTLPMGAMGADTGKTLPVQPEAGSTLPLDFNPAASNADDGKTIAVIKETMGIDPVVGWLVCISGSEKGKDYRIHADNNFIGRSGKMDICIDGDETISRENHAVVSYDTVDGTYYFSPGDGRSIVRYNGKAIFQTTELKSHDHLIIGKTELVFVPFCNEQFSWTEE